MPTELDTSAYSRIRHVLANVLAPQHAAVEIVSQHGSTLVLSVSAHDVWGFAVVDGQPKAAYDISYGAFKRLYKDHHDAWQKRTLAFVLCRQQEDPQQDAFFMSVQADVFFCKKYVIGLAETDTALRDELDSLPIAPLPKGATHGVLRPPTAQDLLGSVPLSAEWAKRIVKPYEYSSARFVDDVVSGRFIVPTQFATPVRYESGDSEAALPMTRVNALEVQGFRAYKKKQRFNLDGDVVVLYGPNGLGKTSLFDAIDFICTGRIGRLCEQKKKMDNDDFIPLARHLDAGSERSEVAMEISGAQAGVLARDVCKWEAASLGDVPLDRKQALQLLTSTPLAENTLGLERLFRASHLFGQSHHGLLLTFKNSSVLSQELVSKMFSLEDYASGLKKIEEVMSALDQRTKTLSQSLLDVRSQCDKAEKELASLSQGVSTPVESSALEQLAVGARQSLTRLLREPVSCDLKDPAALRDQRVILTSAITDTRARITNAHALMERWPEVDACRTDMAATKGRHDALKTRRLDISRRKTLVDETLVRLTDKAGTKSDALAANAREVTALQALMKARAELSALDGRMKIAAAKKQQMGSARSQAQQQLTAAAKRICDTTAKRDEQRRARASAESRLLAVRQLVAGLQQWHTDLESLSTTRERFQQEQARLHVLDKEIGERQDQLKRTTEDLATAEADLASVSEGHTTLIRLLDDIEKCVTSHSCPTCGAKYRSRDALINRIQAQKASRPDELQAKADLCQRLSKSASELKQSTAQLKVRQNHERSMSEQSASRVAELDRAVTSFQKRLEGIGLSCEVTEVESALRQAESAAACAVAETVREAEAAERAVSQAAEAKSVADQQMAITAEGLTACEKDSTEISDATDAVRLRLAQLPVSGDFSDSVATKRILDLRSASDSLGAEFQDAQKAMGKAEADLQQLRRDLDSTVTEIEKTERDIAKQQEMVAAYEMSLVGLGIHSGATSEAIIQRRTEMESQCIEMSSLLDKLHFLETAIDANTRSVRASELKERIAVAKESASKSEAEAVALERGRKGFQGLHDLLNGERRNVVKRYIDAYGPLASVIQRRLRNVYGFGDIRLLERSGEVHVEVRRGELWKKPTDYFSDSQTQILMLSLFLAGRLTQTWSGFAPVLLDDPVTHFDDLNAYSFVELIRGLVDDRPRCHQFIISTCEDRLFSLMQNKLAYLDKRAIFYQFTSIGADGPEFRRLGENRQSP